MELDPNFSEFVQLLNANGVEYLIVGGYAVVFYGHPRFTGDLDIWIAPTAENCAKMVRVMEEFGLASLGLIAEDFCKPDRVPQIGYPPLRIDIMNTVDGVDFAEAYQARTRINTDSGNIQFLDIISRHHLLVNKRATGRYKDLNDIEHL